MDQIVERRSVDAAARRRCDAPVARAKMFGIPVACVDTASMTAEIARFLDTRDPSDPGRFVCFRDVHGVVLAQDDRVLMQAHRDAHLVVADGKPLAILGRLRGHSAMRQVRGMDSLPHLCQVGIAREWRHYFLGGGPGVAAELAAEMVNRIPGLLIAGTEFPPFRPLTSVESEAMIARINDARPDLVWVGLGSPKQELWMAEIAPRLNGAICLGVGAAFDIHTGRVAEAPSWVRRAGIEWAFRIAQEPRRLTGRYLRAIPRFLGLIAVDAISRRTNL